MRFFNCLLTIVTGLLEEEERRSRPTINVFKCNWLKQFSPKRGAGPRGKSVALIYWFLLFEGELAGEAGEEARRGGTPSPRPTG